MSTDLLSPSGFVPPSTAVQISQQAPQTLQRSPKTSVPWPLSIFTSNETQETWNIYENLFLSCLRTGDDKSAFICLERLTDRFGERNERVMALRGMYNESLAENDAEVEKVLKNYESTLKESPLNMPIRKRYIALLRSTRQYTDAIAALVNYLDFAPVDAEAWAELADLYCSQGMFTQAVYCLEEVLLISPLAWNIHARLAEALYAQTMAEKEAKAKTGDVMRGLSEAMRRFCRSVELCDDYLRGYYGLKLTTNKILELFPESSKPSSALSDPIVGDLAPPPITTVKQLNELSTSKLADICRQHMLKAKDWDGYDEAEVIAARELLNRDEQQTER